MGIREVGASGLSSAPVRLPRPAIRPWARAGREPWSWDLQAAGGSALEVSRGDGGI